MIKVSMEVRKGASRFAVAVSAVSVERATGLVRGRYPGGDYRVLRAGNAVAAEHVPARMAA